MRNGRNVELGGNDEAGRCWEMLVDLTFRRFPSRQPSDARAEDTRDWVLSGFMMTKT